MTERTESKHTLRKVSKEVLWINMTGNIEQYHSFTSLNPGQTTQCNFVYSDTKGSANDLYRITTEDQIPSRTKYIMMPERFVRSRLCVCVLPLIPTTYFFTLTIHHIRSIDPRPKVCFLPHIFILTITNTPIRYIGIYMGACQSVSSSSFSPRHE